MCNLMKNLSISFIALALVAGACTPSGKGSFIIRGRVCDSDGKPIAGAVVSDCRSCVRTDSRGRYSMRSDSVAFVYVSTPSLYKAPTTGAHVDFYKDLTCQIPVRNTYRADFTLERMIGNPEEYTVLLLADPQPRARERGYDNIAFHSLDCFDDAVRDVAEYVAGLGDEYCFSMTLGDLVHEDMSLYPAYFDAMDRTGIPAYGMLGNHDHDRSQADDRTSAGVFESLFGPTYYSFNVGRQHYIVLDNIIMYPQKPKGQRNYEYGLTDVEWEWLQNDLKFVDKSTTLIISAHQPLFDMKEGDFLLVDETVHMDDYTALLSQYDRVICWAGHRHHTYNCIYDEPALQHVEQHIMSRITGALWTNEWANLDGVPRGYGVMKVRGDSLSWIFHPIKYQTVEFLGQKRPEYKYRPWDYVDGVARMKSDGSVLDESYQMNVFAPGAYGDRSVYASIFMWDSKWQAPVLEVNGQLRPMEMKLMEDKAGAEILDFYKKYDKRLSGRDDYGRNYETQQNVFRCDVSDLPHGKGTVKVADRFGNVFESDVRW